MARQCKILNVAEKNDAARELSKVMAGGRVQRVNRWFSAHIAGGVFSIFFFFLCRGKDSPNLIRFMSLIFIFLGR